MEISGQCYARGTLPPEKGPKVFYIIVPRVVYLVFK
jgi:hypothetical protein